MQSPANLLVYEKSLELASWVYELSRGLPPDERYGLTSQMRRAAVSISANIAEGCGRSGNRALVAFLHVVLGSATELETLLIVASRLRYTEDASAKPVQERTQEIKRMISRLISRLRPRPDRPA